MRRQPVKGRYCVALTVLLSWMLCVFGGLGEQSLSAGEVGYIPGVYSKNGLPVVSPNALPTGGRVLSGAATFENRFDSNSQHKNRLIVHQESDEVVIDWDRFDIGRQAWTHFDQQNNTGFKALNQIHDQNPSQILGKLTADGQIYLINQNGILFGPGSQINVHSLVASALNITPEDWLNASISNIRFERGSESPLPTSLEPWRGTVSNHGTIAAKETGNIYLLGTDVENHGTLMAPLGRIVMAAGGTVEIAQELDNTTNTFYNLVRVDDPGLVSIGEGGLLLADAGSIGIMGREVRHDGVIRSVSTLTKNGVIELRAAEVIATGAGSTIGSPISDSSETADAALVFLGGDIRFGGLLGLEDVRVPSEPVHRIVHRGTIEAPAGLVDMSARDRIYLGAKSVIDVGGLWLTQSASDNLVALQLNSVELRDEFLLKNSVLRGQTIYFDPRFGTSVGNVAEALQRQDLTARERATIGGLVLMDVAAAEGDIVIDTGATIDISGGGIRYSEDGVQLTSVLVGNRVYAISDLPDYLNIDNILGTYTKSYERWGVEQEYPGSWYGGAVPLMDTIAGYTQGADAGRLSLIAPTVIFNGTLLAGAEAGFYQTEFEEPTDDLGYQIARGRRTPRGGTLEIGANKFLNVGYEALDPVTNEIVVTDRAPDVLAADFDPLSSSLPSSLGGVTYLSSRQLSDARLGTLKLFATKTVTTTPETAIATAPFGQVALFARNILHQGVIRAPSGTAILRISSNISTNPGTPDYISPEVLGPERLFLASGSRIDVSGVRTDNSLAGIADNTLLRMEGPIDGGSISLNDETLEGEGVFIQQGAAVDVSGGFTVSPAFAVEAGKAGTLAIQGHAVALDGTLKGYAVEGAEGGHVSVHAQTVAVVPSDEVALSTDFGFRDPLPEVLQNRFILGDDRFTATGFTQISLSGQFDLAVQAGSRLTPSSYRFASPTTTDSGGLELEMASSGLFGPSGIHLSAGQAFTNTDGNASFSLDNDDSRRLAAIIATAPGTRIETGPGGTAALQAPGIDAAGIIVAPAGDIRIKTTRNDSTAGLTLRAGSRLRAEGVNIPLISAAVGGRPAGFDALPGGSITLDAAGALRVGPDTLLDVSGGAATYQTVAGTGAGGPEVQKLAGHAGRIDVNYVKDASPGGSFIDNVTLSGHHAPDLKLEGGRLSLLKKNTLDPLSVRAGLLADVQAGGFDSLRLASLGEIRFEESIAAAFQEKLVLDAPLIVAADGSRVAMAAPWTTVTNTFFPTERSVAAGSGRITLAGQFVDVSGTVKFSNVDSLELRAEKDIRLADRLYTVDGDNPLEGWAGDLTTAGDIHLTANRIYPITLSLFEMRSDQDIFIHGNGPAATAPLYSAGGRLTLIANRIQQDGFLAAPMGTLRLIGSGEGSRILLSEDSVTTTGGNAAVLYGGFEEDDPDAEFWKIVDKAAEVPSNRLALDVEAAPEGRMVMEADEIIAKGGSLSDISGGGSVFSYQFIRTVDGTANPISKRNRYVILPDEPNVLPGDTVYLAGGNGIERGRYTLLSEEFAFLPGAVFLEDIGAAGAFLGDSITNENYPTLLGSAPGRGANQLNAPLRRYAVRDAGAVLKEGSFIVKNLSGGNAGELQAHGRTTIFQGTIDARSLPGYQTGVVSLAAERAKIQKQVALLDENVGLDTAIGLDTPYADFVKTLRLDEGFFDRTAAGRIKIGTAGLTRSVEVDEGVAIHTGALVLQADESIAISRGARLESLGPDGGIALLASKGRILIGNDARVRSTNDLTLDTLDLSSSGFLNASKQLSLISDRILVGADFRLDDKGIRLDDRLLAVIAATDTVNLYARNDFVFDSETRLVARNRLNIVADGFVNASPAEDGIFSLRAKVLSLSSDGFDASATDHVTSGLLTLDADAILLEGGRIAFDGFADTRLVSREDILFLGKGALSTPGNLSFEAARLSSALSQNGAGLETVDYEVYARDRLDILKNDQSPGEDLSVGGRILFAAGELDHRGRMDFASGSIVMQALDGDLQIAADGQVLATGSDILPGGQVSLTSFAGDIRVAPGAQVDVSAGVQGDAGAVTLEAPLGEVIIGGTLLGRSTEGRGGRFGIETQRLDFADPLTGVDRFSDLLQIVSAGGFTGAIAITAASGDLNVTEDDVLSAEGIALIADGGDLTVNGRLNATTGDGNGFIRLVARDTLTLSDSAQLIARGLNSEASGGRVELFAGETGRIVADGAAIDIDGQPGMPGGGLYLRAPRNADNRSVALTFTDTAIRGAETVSIEGYAVMAQTDLVNTGQISSSDWARWSGDIGDFAAAGPDVIAAFRDGLTAGSDIDGINVLPGIEVRSVADLVIRGYDLTGRYPPGVLTVRTAANLALNGQLSDHPSFPEELNTVTTLNSWGFNMVAGSALASPDIMKLDSVVPGEAGMLTLLNNSMIYTETGAIRFAAHDMEIKPPPASPQYIVDDQGIAGGALQYSLATFSGSIEGHVAGDLVLNRGVIQSSVGSIVLTIGRDLKSVNRGAIRTIGQAAIPNDFLALADFADYRDGGDVAVRVGGLIDFEPDQLSGRDRDPGPAWLQEATTFASGELQIVNSGSYFGADATSGIATLGGGNVTITAAGDVLVPAGTFNGGDLFVTAGGNLDGRFLIRGSAGYLGTAKSFGTLMEDQPIELGRASVTVIAQGDIALGTVLNPDLATKPVNKLTLATIDKPEWNLGYGLDSTVTLMSKRGSVAISGATRYYNPVEEKARSRFMPPRLIIEAAEDVIFSGDVVLMPSPQGLLSITAGYDVDGFKADGRLNQSRILISDVDPAGVYGIQTTDSRVLIGRLQSAFAHDNIYAGAAEFSPFTISAGGNIEEIGLIAPAPARLLAGNDIRNIFFLGQNLAEADQTIIQAAHDIQYRIEASERTNYGIQMGGPGFTTVNAGNNIDLGSSAGIEMVGNQFNPALKSDNADLLVLAGIATPPSQERTGLFFGRLRDIGNRYSQAKQGGDLAEEGRLLDEARMEIVDLLGEGPYGEGNLVMVNSQISTSGDPTDISAIFTGRMDIGRSTLPPPPVLLTAADLVQKNSGIFTVAGGGINLFTFNDVNVNESRVMTFGGGDITVWSDFGNINAGRGSKTAITVSENRIVVDDEGNLSTLFVPPAVGSGIRTLTFDPDGPAGPLPLPDIGDAFLFAPRGEIDAGEAGISARNLVLAAQRVVNTQNISVSGTSVGVPTSDATVNLGAIAGSSNVTEASKVGDTAASLETAQQRLAESMRQLADNFVPRWLTIEIIGFGD